MTIYKLSIVVFERRDIGGIRNFDKKPQPGDRITLDKEEYEIIKVVELMPPRGNFVYLHAICQPIQRE